jgi:hypothetical protein
MITPVTCVTSLDTHALWIGTVSGKVTYPLGHDGFIPCLIRPMQKTTWFYSLLHLLSDWHCMSTIGNGIRGRQEQKCRLVVLRATTRFPF